MRSTFQGQQQTVEGRRAWLSPRRKLQSTAKGRVMLSHDASLRTSEAASRSMAFSTNMN